MANAKAVTGVPSGRSKVVYWACAGLAGSIAGASVYFLLTRTDPIGKMTLAKDAPWLTGRRIA